MAGDELRRDHALKLVLRPNASQPGYRSNVLAIARVFVGILEPERLHGLVGKNFVPMVGLRSANMFEGAPPVIGIVGHHRCGLIVVGSGFLCAHRHVLTFECRLMKGQRRRRPAARDGSRLLSSTWILPMYASGAVGKAVNQDEFDCACACDGEAAIGVLDHIVFSHQSFHFAAAHGVSTKLNGAV